MNRSSFNPLEALRWDERRRSEPPRLPPLLTLAAACKAVAVLVWFHTAHRTMALGLFVAPDPLLLYALFAPSAQGLCRVFTEFETSRRELWLTIDDGPDEHDTPRILDLLERHEARATFFVTGEKAERWPHLVSEIRRRGHEVAHHTHTHPAWTFWCAGPRRLASELDNALAVLEKLDVRPRRFRPPVGIKHLLLGRALAARRLDCIGWTVRSGDCRVGSPADLVARLTERLRPGAILLLHEGPSVAAAVRVTGLALLLEEVARRGFVCTIPARDRLR